MHEIERKIEELRERIAKIAREGADGATYRCDVLHGRIGVLEQALDILMNDSEEDD